MTTYLVCNVSALLAVASIVPIRALMVAELVISIACALFPSCPLPFAFLHGTRQVLDRNDDTAATSFLAVQSSDGRARFLRAA